MRFGNRAKGRKELVENFRQKGIKSETIAEMIHAQNNLEDESLNSIINNLDALELSSRGEDKAFARFLDDNDARQASWNIGLDSQGEVLRFSRGEGPYPLFSLAPDAKMGVKSSIPADATSLHVNGLLASNGYAGTYGSGYILADQQWHDIPILMDLTGCKAFEVIAQIRDTEDSMYANGFARIALTIGWVYLNTFEKRRKARIKKMATASRWLWGNYWNKITMRWKAKPIAGKQRLGYTLQLKTRTHFGTTNGEPKQVYYQINQIWEETF